MSDAKSIEGDFIEQAASIILENVSNEQFGVSELAAAMSMSRSNLLRKVKKYTRLSPSLFIRQVRLKKGMEMLRQTSLTVSEVSYQVGFGSTSYFIKCFREYYGYPPGEVGKRELVQKNPETNSSKPFPWQIIIGALLALLVVSVLLLFKKMPPDAEHEPEKSIAVLPFKNESSDSTNVYFINGLMESTLNNLQKIKGLRVISRTSMEKYRNTNKAIPEIAKELNVSYFVEGSGQKIGDQVLLNIQLIEASSDKHIWSEQYSRKVGNVFALQNEVATKIAHAIEVIVTPAELAQIEKRPTKSIEAYDYFLQGLDPFLTRTKEGLEKAISLFEKAIDHDPQFSLAYADIAIAYYFLDLYQTEKQYTEQINNYADKALLYDSKSAESLISKAFYYLHTKEYRLALPHLEKALEYNPNSTLAIQMLADFYSYQVPNTAKYLEYALKGMQLDIAANDSITKSYIYLQLSNAFIQTGFIEEAVKYINLSLDHNQENYYAPYLKAFILYARDRNLEQTKQLLLREWNMDTSRLDILQDVAKVYYLQENYDSAFFYFQKFVKAREINGLDIYAQEDLKIGRVYERMGLQEEAAKFFNAFSAYCEKDQSIYKSANLAMKYAHEGKIDQAIEQLKIFSNTDNYQYWFLLLENDPLMKPLKKHPEFDGIIQKIEDRFWENQAQLRKSLEEKGLI
ncbi:MAG: helix-turn-helix domain-containing protein [Saprospiraceae bacterium]|nr:helix-turn-helix domain-containing protein [Lewinella sp.]